MCPACSSAAPEVFYEARGVPVHDVMLMPTAQIAIQYPRGDVALGFCRDCGFIANLRFDPQQMAYAGDCEETQGFSPVFRCFQRRLAERLIDAYGVRGKQVVEIGCGKGEFLTLLCELGENAGVGFDPAYVPERNHSLARERIRFVTDFYSEQYAGCDADLVVCQMTLEHVQPVERFAGLLRRMGGRNRRPVVFVQVPNVEPILKELRFWDIYYEHCSYFSAGSLGRLFRRAGFEVLRLGTEYGGQYLTLEAQAGCGGEPSEQESLEELAREVERFRNECPGRLEKWRSYLRRLRQEGRRVALWGGGSKAVAFLTTLGVGAEVHCVVDINPYRQNTFVAGTGHRIAAPSQLRECRPDVVIVMNPMYGEEIRRALQEQGLSPQMVSV
jgi:SAM-dependent methyltransferase